MDFNVFLVVCNDSLMEFPDLMIPYQFLLFFFFVSDVDHLSMKHDSVGFCCYLLVIRESLMETLMETIKPV